MQSHALRQFHVGANAHRHHHQVGGNLCAILELDGGNPAIRPTHQFLGLCTHQEAQAAFFE